MRILMLASEGAPFAKTGGLADVVGALPAALERRGETVAVVMPRYRKVNLDHAQRVYADLRVWFGPASHLVSIYQTAANGVPFYLVDCPPLFDRPALYGDEKADYPDNHIRFAVFCRAALTIARHLFRPDILHCHDWQAALAPVYLHTLLSLDPTFLSIKTLFTIHNLGYAGLFAKQALAEIALDPALFHPDYLEFHGKVSLLKGGLVFSDALSTVSPTYAREIQTPEFGFGLDGLLRARRDVFTGILNGVDYSEWSPETDPYIAAHYSATDLAGKIACKRELLREFGLPEKLDRPLTGVVSRFAGHKGLDLIKKVAGDLAAEDLAVVALGTGEPRCEQMFRDLAARYPGKIAVRVAFDNRLAHKIEAGSDMFLMPSRYEPCGLNQIYSLRYGTIPIVRATGGLDDTIEESTGFKFYEYSGRALLEAVRAALATYRDRPRWEEMMRHGMQKDFSWDASAAEYSALYRRLVGAAAPRAAPAPRLSA